MINFKRKLVTTILGLTIVTTTLMAQPEINIGRIAPGEIDFAGFELTQDATIHIEGEGASFEKWGNNLVFYGWIVDSKSREVVWNLLDEYESEYFHGEGSFDFKASLRLSKGSYEIYFTGMYDRSGYNYYKNDFADLVQEVVKAIVEDDDHPYYRKEKYYLTASGDEKSFKVIDGTNHVDKLAEQSIASFVRTGDDEVKSKSFALTRETTLKFIAWEKETDENFTILPEYIT